MIFSQLYLPYLQRPKDWSMDGWIMWTGRFRGDKTFKGNIILLLLYIIHILLDLDGENE